MSCWMRFREIYYSWMAFMEKWLVVIVIALALLLIPSNSLDIESSFQRLDGTESTHVPVSISIRDEGEATAEILSNLVDQIAANTQISTEDAGHEWLNQGTKNDSGSCGIECLECQNGECKRYNWIGVICVVMLVLNLLAIAYCILLVRKMRRRPSTKDSLLTEGSFNRSMSHYGSVGN